MNILLVAEVISGLAGLLLTAMAFTALAWGEGASAHTMQRASMTRARRLFIAAAVLWAVAILSYLCMVWRS